MAWRRVTIAPHCHCCSIVNLLSKQIVAKGEGGPQQSIVFLPKNINKMVLVSPNSRIGNATVAKKAGSPVVAGPAVSGAVINLYLAGNLCNNDIWHSAQSPT